MEEYLDALMPMLNGGISEHAGERLTARTMGPLTIVDSPSVDVLLAALAPRMLKLAGTLTAGTITWMTGLETIENYVVPTITEAAESVGRTPRIVVGIPICVTSDEAAAREKIDQQYAIYPNLPSYKAMLDKQGATRPSDIAIVGSREVVAEQLAAFEQAGATEIFAAPSGSAEDRAQTFAYLGELALS
jgi:alkanesulfonate monooxygenase SsuD/methylene tetrahydromethanopterin reductase-like flavin-dependent oxidoreductase (luciferase family)